MWGQELLGDLSEEVERERQPIVGFHGQRRVDQLTTGEGHKLGVLSVKVRHPDSRKSLQPGTEGTLGFTGPLCDAPEFALLPVEKAHNQIAFFKRIGAQDKRFTDPRGHLPRVTLHPQLQRIRDRIGG